jgi:hypothetical protein
MTVQAATNLNGDSKKKENKEKLKKKQCLKW